MESLQMTRRAKAAAAEHARRSAYASAEVERGIRARIRRGAPDIEVQRTRISARRRAFLQEEQHWVAEATHAAIECDELQRDKEACALYRDYAAQMAERRREIREAFEDEPATIEMLRPPAEIAAAA